MTVSLRSLTFGELSETTPLRLRLSDSPDAERSEEWIEVQIAIPAKPGQNVGSLQLDALRYLQKLIDAEIDRHEALKTGRMR